MIKIRFLMTNSIAKPLLPKLCATALLQSYVVLSSLKAVINNSSKGFVYAAIAIWHHRII